MEPTEIVTQLIAAIADGREADALALVDRHVTWQPLARPGLTLYQDHSGFSRMLKDLHKAYGPFRVEIEEIRAIGNTQVVTLARAVLKTRDGDVPRPTVRSVFTLKNGLVTGMEAEYSED